MKHIFISSLVSSQWQIAFPESEYYSVYSPDIFVNAEIIWLMLDKSLTLDSVKHLAARAKVVVLTSHESPEQAREVIQAGASGYIHYLSPAALLTQVASSVINGGIWLGADLMMALVRLTAPVAQFLHKPDTSLLTQREHDVVKQVCEGYSNKEIAKNLTISERTVKAHLSAIFEKYQLRDRLHLALLFSHRN